MFARVTQLEIDVMRTSVEEAAGRFDAEVLPELRRGSPAGFGTVITLWEREEDAAPDERYDAVLARYVTLFRAPPGREVYEVLLADLPRAAEAASA